MVLPLTNTGEYIDWQSGMPKYHSLHVSLHPAGRRPSTSLLSAPFVRTSFGARSFSVAASKIWNSLPPSLRTCTGLDTLPSSRQDPLLPASVLTIVRVYKLYLLTYFAPHSFTTSHLSIPRTTLSTRLSTVGDCAFPVAAAVSPIISTPLLLVCC